MYTVNEWFHHRNQHLETTTKYDEFFCPKYSDQTNPDTEMTYIHAQRIPAEDRKIATSIMWYKLEFQFVDFYASASSENRVEMWLFSTTFGMIQ